MNLGQCIRRLREQKGLTLAEVGARIGRTKQWMSELERGNIKLTYETAVAIARVFETTPDNIFLSHSRSGEVAGT
ncbi:MAG: helix-turn-helix domain-containing protein [Alicyclobacillus sp.]|nr:helix-turn-helix domain-containing protein [Alicyclobacillus sp.]